MAGDAHRFRFFVATTGVVEAVASLTAADAEHVRVLRLETGDPIEVVDADGLIWDAALSGPDRVQLRSVIEDAPTSAAIELIAGALTGNRFDELVDGAVQAGASAVVPLVASARDRDRLAQRSERLQRLAVAAAKQSKQSRIADVRTPIDADALLDLEPGIVLDAAATVSLLDVELPTRDLRLLIGPADGLDPVLVSRLVDAGWTLAKLGPSILRAELAAPVAVAVLAMRMADDPAR